MVSSWFKWNSYSKRTQKLKDRKISLLTKNGSHGVLQQKWQSEVNAEKRGTEVGDKETGTEAGAANSDEWGLFSTRPFKNSYLSS